jgi:hypothetical protein
MAKLSNSQHMEAISNNLPMGAISNSLRMGSKRMDSSRLSNPCMEVLPCMVEPEGCSSRLIQLMVEHLRRLPPVLGNLQLPRTDRSTTTTKRLGKHNGRSPRACPKSQEKNKKVGNVDNGHMHALYQ